MRVIVIPLNSTEPEFRDVEEYSTVGDVVANCHNYDLDTEVFENMVIEECEVVEEDPDTIEIEVVVFGNRQRLQVAPVLPWPTLQRRCAWIVMPESLCVAPPVPPPARFSPVPGPLSLSRRLRALDT